MEASAKASVDATVQVAPTKSQVVLVTLAIGAMLALVLSAAMFFLDKPGPGVLFALIGAAAFGGTLWAWLRSQADVDMEGPPTTIALPDGTSLSTDSRSLRSVEAFQALAGLCNTLLHRRPLPEPAGMVDPMLKVIPGSEREAIEYVKDLNEAIRKDESDLLDSLAQVGADSGATGIEVLGEHMTQPLEILDPKTASASAPAARS
jgi:hypothetical protein